MDQRYAEVKNPGQLRAALADLSTPCGDVRKIRLLCTEGHNHDFILCLVEATSGGHAIAKAIGGFMFGSTPVVHFGPVPGDFLCARRGSSGACESICHCETVVTPVTPG